MAQALARPYIRPMEGFDHRPDHRPEVAEKRRALMRARILEATARALLDAWQREHPAAILRDLRCVLAAAPRS